MESTQQPRWWNWLWLAMVGWAAFWQGPAILRQIYPDRSSPQDFFQEWASARNAMLGLPVYTRHIQSIEWYLGRHVESEDELYIRVNAHPPTTVLLAWPFALLDYPEAALIWNLLSVLLIFISGWLVVRELQWKPPLWVWLALATLLLMCNPLRQQVNQGQLNGVLLALLTAAWLASRWRRLAWAGVFIGVAAAIKLFPAFVMLYFLVRREWRAVLAGVATGTLTIAVTAAVLGPTAFYSYFVDVVPGLHRFQAEWINASITGFWTKLFDPAASENGIHLLWPSATVAKIGIAISSAVVIGITCWVIHRGRHHPHHDLGFAATLTAMLLVSPITWDHYFLLLLVPVAVLIGYVSDHPWARRALALAAAGLWVNTVWIHDLIMPEPWTARSDVGPATVLTLLAFPFYALLGLFALQVYCEWVSHPDHSRRRIGEAAALPEAHRSAKRRHSRLDDSRTSLLTPIE